MTYIAFAGEGFPEALSLEELIFKLWLIGLWGLNPVCFICSVIVALPDMQLDVVYLALQVDVVEDVRGDPCRFR